MAKNMRGQFPWYFLENEDTDAAWKEGILTVDANVMLDLYRYNKSTREELLSALERFNGRFWISHQTAKEFIWNRRSVISGINDDFVGVEKPINNVKATVSEISKFRAIPDDLIEAFRDDIEKASSRILKGIKKERGHIPDYKKHDEVIERLEKALAKTPGGGVGSLPNDIEEDVEEAQRRKDEKIPPGYEDDGKDGLKFAGDYFMWKQILSYCKENQKPMIFVTSESKGDWWQTKSGKTLSPRLELLQEAFEETGQKFLIYRTEQFLEKQNILGVKVDKSILDEVSKHSEPAVSTTQELDFADAEINMGRMIINISRPVKNFTGTGQLNPKMLSLPEMFVTLIERPEGTPECSVRANTGTIFNFNIHVHSRERNVMLPVGQYVLEYVASLEDFIDDINGDYFI